MLPQHSTLEVEFALPGLTETFHIAGSVMWARDGRTGLQFTDVPSNERKELVAWLDSKFTGAVESRSRVPLAAAR
jgi:hypothetical protein